MENKTFAQKVREKYGDTIEEFALRLGVQPTTVRSWEEGFTPQSQVLALLIYANSYNLPFKSDADEKYQKMNVRDLIHHLMATFNDNETELAMRLCLSRSQIVRITRRTSVNKSTKRLLLEAVAHPENFTQYTKV